MTKVKENCKIKLHYTGKLDDGTIFDSTKKVEDTMFADKEPIEVELGKGYLLPKFEEGLLGLEIGEKRNIKLECKDAYGEHDPNKVQEVSKEQVPEDVTEGAFLQTQGEQGIIMVKVSEIKENSVLLDYNSQLVGQDLDFTVEVTEITNLDE